MLERLGLLQSKFYKKEFIYNKTKVASLYFPVEPEFILNKIIESDYYFASIKYDGFCYF